MINGDKDLQFQLKHIKIEGSTISFIKKDEIPAISSNYMVAQTCINTKDGEELEKNTKFKDQVHGNLHDSFYDTDPDVYDVHVINDNIELREEGKKVKQLFIEYCYK